MSSWELANIFPLETTSNIDVLMVNRGIFIDMHFNNTVVFFFFSTCQFYCLTVIERLTEFVKKKCDSQKRKIHCKFVFVIKIIQFFP